MMNAAGFVAFVVLCTVAILAVGLFVGLVVDALSRGLA